MARMTSKKFLEFVNEQFKKYEIKDWVAVRVINPRHRSCDIEAGACRLIVYIKYIKAADPNSILAETYFYCFYTLYEYEDYLKSGYEMYLKVNGGLYQEMEIDVRRVGKKV